MSLQANSQTFSLLLPKLTIAKKENILAKLFLTIQQNQALQVRCQRMSSNL